MPGTAARRQSADPLEFYPTPAWMTGALLLKVRGIGRRGDVLEPTAGDGAIVEVLERGGRTVRAFDLAPRRLELPLLGAVRDVSIDTADATDAAFWHPERLAGVSWCVGNPPFSLGTVIRDLARGARLRLALLLRLNALEPTEDHAPWLAGDPPSDLVLMPRGSFGGSTGGGDMVPAFWFTWRFQEPRPGRATRLHVVTPAERHRLEELYRPGWHRRRRRTRTETNP